MELNPVTKLVNCVQLYAIQHTQTKEFFKGMYKEPEFPVYINKDGKRKANVPRWEFFNRTSPPDMDERFVIEFTLINPQVWQSKELLQDVADRLIERGYFGAGILEVVEFANARDV